MYLKRNSNCWNTINRQMTCTKPPLVDSKKNGLEAIDISPLQSSVVQCGNVGLDAIQPFAPVSQTCTPRAIRKRLSYTDCSNQQMESSFMQHWTSSDSDSSSSDLSDLMSSLSLSQTGPYSPITEQELSNLRALHTLTSSSGPCNPRLPSPLLHNSCSYSDNIDLLEKVAYFYRNQAASYFEAACRWEGVLRRHLPDNPTFSCKVFLGGVPWDMNEETLVSAFSQFGKVRVEWPGKNQAVNQPRGYAYIIFDTEKQVKMLLNSSSCDFSDSGCLKWSFCISSRKMKPKEVEVIPWCLTDSNFVQSPSQKLNPNTTVFVGALHGMLNAEGLFTVMNELFGGVVYIGIDTDKFKYPIGAARVTFNNWQSYMNAVMAAFIEIKTTKFTKKIQVDPYLEDSLCSYCMVQQGLYFCREFTCFRYFCRNCWVLYHQSDLQLSHNPLMRNFKNNISFS